MCINSTAVHSGVETRSIDEDLQALDGIFASYQEEADSIESTKVTYPAILETMQCQKFSSKFLVETFKKVSFLRGQRSTPMTLELTTQLIFGVLLLLSVVTQLV